MNEIHRVEGITFTGACMLMTVDGKGYSCALAEVSDRLTRASDVERENYEVSPSGYGIHWPLVDEDLTVDGLIRMAKPSARPFAKMTGIRRLLFRGNLLNSFCGKKARQS